MGLQRWAGSCETLDATKHFLHTGDPPEYLRRAWIWVWRGSLWPQASRRGVQAAAGVGCLLDPAAQPMATGLKGRWSALHPQGLLFPGMFPRRHCSEEQATGVQRPPASLCCTFVTFTSSCHLWAGRSPPSREEAEAQAQLWPRGPRSSRGTKRPRGGPASSGPSPSTGPDQNPWASASSCLICIQKCPLAPFCAEGTMLTMGLSRGLCLRQATSRHVVSTADTGHA